MARDTFVDACLAVGAFATAQFVISITLDASAVFEGFAVLAGISVCVLLRRLALFRQGDRQKKLYEKKVEAAQQQQGQRPKASFGNKEASKDASGLARGPGQRSTAEKAAPTATMGAADESLPESLRLGAPEAGASNVLITAVRRGRLWEVPRLLDEALERAAAEHPFDDDAQCESIQSCLISVLRTCSVAHQHHAAMAAFDHIMSKQSEYPVIKDLGSGVLWSVLLYNAVEAKEYHRCADVYGRLCAVSEPCNHDFVNIVHALANLRNHTEFKKLMASVANMNFDALTRTRALGVCCSEGAFEMAEALMSSKVFSEELNEMNFNTIMKGYGRKGQLHKCKALFGQMQSLGLKPTQMTYGILLDAAVSAKDFASVRKIFRDFVDSGLRANAIHYTTLIKAIIHDGRLEEVDELLELMESSTDAKPDLITYQLAMRAHAEKGNVEATVKLLKHVISLGMRPDSPMYESVLSSCCSERLPASKALAVFDDLVRCGMEPTCAASSKLLRALCQTKSWSTALEFLRSLKTRFGVVADAFLFAQLGLSCIRSDDLNMAVLVHTALNQAHGSRISRNGTATCASARLLGCCIAEGDLKAAKALAFAGAGKAIETAAARATSRPTNSKRLETFVAINRIDDRCGRLLAGLQPGQADWVMDQEFIIQVDESKGTASAKVVSHVRRSKSTNVAWEFYPGREDLRKRRLVAFLQLNSLAANTQVVSALSSLTDEQLRSLMDQDFLVEALPGRTVAQTVLAAVEKAKELPSGDDVFGGLLAEYIALNGIDDRCANSLRSLSRADAAWIMDQEFRIEVDPGRGTASAKVIGLINRVRSGELRY
eukprot:TRINITY_DN101056_c0_g1_i1.p1 TRINITY_DN101056_c0_g1~~TRINITY_DN101056_c0_g1_i1.p1  ORF type:complete len:831 (-),score=220.69 TRINITY_DN101056_c0_g1_i1:54-2546(-)